MFAADLTENTPTQNGGNVIDWVRAKHEWNAVSDEITDAAYEGRWLDWERWRDLLATIPNPKWLRTEPWTDSDRTRVTMRQRRAA